jgi:hypothetical protein
MHRLHGHVTFALAQETRVQSVKDALNELLFTEIKFSLLY